MQSVFSLSLDESLSAATVSQFLPAAHCLLEVHPAHSVLKSFSAACLSPMQDPSLFFFQFIQQVSVEALKDSLKALRRLSWEAKECSSSPSREPYSQVQSPKTGLGQAPLHQEIRILLESTHMSLSKQKNFPFEGRTDVFHTGAIKMCPQTPFQLAKGNCCEKLRGEGKKRRLKGSFAVLSRRETRFTPISMQRKLKRDTAQ